MTDDEIKEACQMARIIDETAGRSPMRTLARALLAVVAQRDEAIEEADYFRHAQNASEDKRSRTNIEADQRGYRRALDEVIEADQRGYRRALDEVAARAAKDVSAWDTMAAAALTEDDRARRNQRARTIEEFAATCVAAGRAKPTGADRD
jgi:hypothetical protein